MRLTFAVKTLWYVRDTRGITVIYGYCCPMPIGTFSVRFQLALDGRAASRTGNGGRDFGWRRYRKRGTQRDRCCLRPGIRSVSPFFFPPCNTKETKICAFRLNRRVDRMEGCVGSVVSKIDAIMNKLEGMDKVRLRHQKHMNKLMENTVNVRIGMLLLDTLMSCVCLGHWNSPRSISHEKEIPSKQ